LSCALTAQSLKLPPSIEKLADKAEEVVDVTLDSSMLGMASQFLSDKDKDEAAAKKLIGGIKGIYVRSFKFSKEGEYSESDVELLRQQLHGPGWSCIVKVRSPKKQSNADVCFLTVSGKITGLAVVASEPKELTIVHINGFIDPEQLHSLEGQFGIPKLNLEDKKSTNDKAH
jgi:hypothetical protein